MLSRDNSLNFSDDSIDLGILDKSFNAENITEDNVVSVATAQIHQCDMGNQLYKDLFDDIYTTDTEEISQNSSNEHVESEIGQEDEKSNKLNNDTKDVSKSLGFNHFNCVQLEDNSATSAVKRSKRSCTVRSKPSKEYNYRRSTRSKSGSLKPLGWIDLHDYLLPDEPYTKQIESTKSFREDIEDSIKRPQSSRIGKK